MMYNVEFGDIRKIFINVATNIAQSEARTKQYPHHSAKYNKLP